MNDPHQPTDPTQASQAAVALTSLPSLEDTEAVMKSAIEQLGGQIATLAPTVAWEWRREASRGGCNPPYEQTDGEQILLRHYVSDTPIPEQNWKQTYDMAQAAATKLGAGTVTVFKDGP
ncbi:MAG: LppA family lipoprotein, partial [Mycobacterium sp.]